MLRAFGDTGLRLARSFRFAHSHASLHPHFCGCWNAPRSLIAAAKTSYTAGTLYAIETAKSYGVFIAFIEAATPPRFLQRITGRYMLRAFGAMGFRSARSAAPPTLHSTHILPALAFASQSPYSGWQNVIYRRNVICHFR
jgi:hypothetical protein